MEQTYYLLAVSCCNRIEMLYICNLFANIHEIYEVIFTWKTVCARDCLGRIEETWTAVNCDIVLTTKYVSCPVELLTSQTTFPLLANNRASLIQSAMTYDLLFRRRHVVA